MAAQLATDLVILHPSSTGTLDAARTRALAAQDATFVAVQTLRFAGGSAASDLLHCHHQHGFDLARLGRGYGLRDIVLLRQQSAAPGTARFALLHIWNTPRSHYDLDAVRIPWAQLPGPRDKRNNPHGKNPTNLWQQAEGLCSSAGIGAQALLRLARCHCHPAGKVHIWADGDDREILLVLAAQAGWCCGGLHAGSPDPLLPIPLEVEQAPAVPVVEPPVCLRWRAAGGGATALARLEDCRAGLRALPRGSVSHVVTSPPYNIGYRPFNVATRDRRSGQLGAPCRRAYRDALGGAAYAGLLRSTFAALDAVACPDGLDVFLNVKSRYKRGACAPPFYLLGLLPPRWRLLDLLIWRYDISYDPARRKYKPIYEWVLRLGFGALNLPARAMKDWYIPILKGNSRERRALTHPAMFPRLLVHEALEASGRPPRLVVDPFAGSGTTLAACLERGVDAVGFELSAAYAEDMRARMRFVGAVES